MASEPDAVVDALSVDAAVWQAGVVSVVEQPGSLWRVALEGGELIARHQQRPLTLLIDAGNGVADQRYAGIYVHVDGKPRFHGRYNDTACSMFVPDRAYKNQERVTVIAAGETLTVTMSEGSLSEMSDSKFPSTEPFRWESSWTVVEGGLRLVSRGLYYLLPPKDGTTITLVDAGGGQLGLLQFSSASSPQLQYFRAPRQIAITSPSIGTLSLSTNAEVVQVEVPQYPATDLVEIDFDHSFKDHGQRDVRTEVVLPLGV